VDFLTLFFFFQKKNQKVLFCFTEVNTLPIIREADPGGLGADPKRKEFSVAFKE
jgi:hypothetical protein